MKSDVFRPCSAVASFAGGRLAGLVVSAVLLSSNAIAQVATGDLAARPSPPIPKSPEQLMGGHGVLMILLGVILLGLVVGACLIPVKRGHMD